MKALVGVKRALDYAIKVRVNKAETAVELKGLKQSINPFCEIAVQEAAEMKKRGVVGEVIALTIGGKDSVQTLRTALAMGADRGIHVSTDLRTDTDLQPLAVAKVLKHFVEKEEAPITILGKQAIDDDSNQTTQILAALLGYPQATFASEILIENDLATVT